MKTRRTILVAAVLTAAVLGMTLIAPWPTHQASPTCTIFTVADQNATFFGNNEDNNDNFANKHWIYETTKTRKEELEKENGGKQARNRFSLF